MTSSASTSSNVPSAPASTASHSVSPSSESHSSFSLERSRQYVSALSILAVALFVGLPVWWKTTEVYRCPLPYKEISDLADRQVPTELMFRIMVTYISKDRDLTPALHRFAAQVQRELVNSSAVASSNVRIRISYAVEPEALDNRILTQLTSFLPHSTIEEFSDEVERKLYTPLGHYTILFVSKDLLPKGITHSDEKTAVYISQYRHSLIGLADSDFASCLPAVLRVVKHVYSERKQLEKILKSISARQQDRVDMDSMRQLRATQGYHIAITLLNPDPSQLFTSWNIKEATDRILLRFLQHHGIANLGKFSVSSQVFYYTDVKFKAKKDKDSYYVLSSQLPPMISSVESKLASHVSQLPSLNFLVYIPKPSEYPLHIRQSSKSSDFTDTFLVAQWGGVMIYNPPELAQQRTVESKHSDNVTKHQNRGGQSSILRDSKGAIKVAVKMEHIMPVFIQQLKMLLGISSSEWPQGMDKMSLHYSQGKLGITDWQVDRLLVSKMVESVSMATTSLISLVQLLDKVKNMVISDHIQREKASSKVKTRFLRQLLPDQLKVELSLQCILKCYELASEGNLEEAYSQAKKAMLSAETAFFDPSILELLYFPDDQKFAIYIPLFLPISVPILLSSIAALKWLAAGFRSRDTGTNVSKTAVNKPKAPASSGSHEESSSDQETSTISKEKCD